MQEIGFILTLKNV